MYVTYHPLSLLRMSPLIHHHVLCQTYLDLGLNRQDPLKLYREEFEIPFVQATDSYYSTLSCQLIQELDIPDYLVQVEDICQQEQIRCEGRLHRMYVDHICYVLRCL